MVETSTLLPASNNRPEEFQQLIISPEEVQTGDIWGGGDQDTATRTLISSYNMRVIAFNHLLPSRERSIRVQHKMDLLNTLADAANPPDVWLFPPTEGNSTEVQKYARALLGEWLSSREKEALPDVVVLFSEGLDGERPSRSVIDMAAQITKEALAKTVQPEITLDVDGALSFDLRLRDGRLVLAELSMAGVLDVSIYSDDLGISFTRLPQATASEFIAYF